MNKYYFLIGIPIAVAIAAYALIPESDEMCNVPIRDPPEITDIGTPAEKTAVGTGEHYDEDAAIEMAKKDAIAKAEQDQSSGQCPESCPNSEIELWTAPLTAEIIEVIVEDDIYKATAEVKYQYSYICTQ